MSDSTQLKTWVLRETKARFGGIARHQGLSNSTLLKRPVDLTVSSTSPGADDAIATANLEATRPTRFTVR